MNWSRVVGLILLPIGACIAGFGLFVGAIYSGAPHGLPLEKIRETVTFMNRCFSVGIICIAFGIMLLVYAVWRSQRKIDT